MHRVCTKCGIGKNEESEFTNRSSKSNLKRSVCKVCEAAYLRAKRAPKLKAKREAKEKARKETLASPLKKCTGCMVEKPKKEFNKAKLGMEGLTAWCKACYKKWVDENKDALSLKQKAYREKNKNIIKERKREYSQTEKSKQQRKEYIRNNPDLKRRIANKYARNNREKNKVIYKKWIKNNPEKYRKYKREYQRNRALNDPGFAIQRRLRSRILSALKVSGARKAAKTVELLGCSIETFKVYLEKLFTPGMTWENRGQWAIDHIIPCASFNFNDPEQQKICFHYTNLQPLWAKEILRKRHKIESPIQVSIPLSHVSVFTKQ